jgi:3',5'-cyclic AMP phosphodiesterase CpdA
LIKFIHITDLHISHPDLDDPNLHSDTEGAFREIIKVILLMEEKPKFVVLSGDLTNTGDKKSYQLLKELLKPLSVPVILAIGNHDKRESFYETFKGKGSTYPYFHDDIYSGLHVVTLDSSIPGRIAGEICDKQFDYLKKTLKKYEASPKLLVLHHPPKMDPDGLPWGSLSMESTLKLENVLRGKNIVGILTGHIHINRVSHWNGVPVCVSNGLHSSVDILETNHLRILEGSSFSICVLRDSGLSVSYVPVNPKQKELGIIDQKRLRKFS